MKIIEEETIMDLVMSAFACGQDRDILDYGFKASRKKGSNVIDICLIDPETREPISDNAFRLVIEKVSTVRSKTVKIIGYPVLFKRRIVLIKEIREATILDLRLSQRLIDSPLPIHIECSDADRADSLRAALCQLKVVFE